MYVLVRAQLIDCWAVAAQWQSQCSSQDLIAVAITMHPSGDDDDEFTALKRRLAPSEGPLLSAEATPHSLRPVRPHETKIGFPLARYR
jgi:hypothetical protein